MATYIDTRNGGYYLAGTRISLDSVVHEFQRGSSPESILRSFPLIGKLELVYGAITYYLAHKEKIDAHLLKQDKLWSRRRREQSLPAGLKKRIEQARRGVSAERR